MSIFKKLFNTADNKQMKDTLCFYNGKGTVCNLDEEKQVSSLLELIEDKLFVQDVERLKQMFFKGCYGTSAYLIFTDDFNQDDVIKLYYDALEAQKYFPLKITVRSVEKQMKTDRKIAYVLDFDLDEKISPDILVTKKENREEYYREEDKRVLKREVEAVVNKLLTSERTSSIIDFAYTKLFFSYGPNELTSMVDEILTQFPDVIKRCINLKPYMKKSNFIELEYKNVKGIKNETQI